MDFIFRTALPSEFADADRVLRAAFTPYLARLGREIPADYYEWLPASIERGDVFVAEEGSRVVGVAAIERREAELFLDRLAVDPSKQGTGLGVGCSSGSTRWPAPAAIAPCRSSRPR